MKRVLFVLLLAACGNKKEGITKQIKIATEEFNLARNWESTYELLQSDLATYGKPTNVDARFLKDIPAHVIENNRTDSARIAWQVKKINAKERIDSLNSELAQY